MGCHRRYLPLFSSLGLMCACSSPPTPDTLEVVVHIDRDYGNQVTIEWHDPRPVHEVAVLTPSEGGWQSWVWGVSVFENSSIPHTSPAISPPLTYGTPVANVFTVSGPFDLEEEIPYEVRVEVYGWGDTCVERGIDVETATSACVIARGVTSFSL